jgi:hypothetical protein
VYRPVAAVTVVPCPPTHDAVARLPLTTLLEHFEALKALQDVAFDDEARGALETFVLRHDV